MKLIEHEFAMVPIEQLKPHPRNPRRGDVREIRKSIRVNGWYGAVVAQKSTGHILAGNHRYLAARREGATALPVAWVDVDDQTALRILLVDNRSNEKGEVVDACLADLLEEIANASKSLAGTGYDRSDLEKLLAETGEGELTDFADQTGELNDEWKIVVDCRSEAEQLELLERLGAEGFECRALVG